MNIEKESKWVKDGEVVELNTARDNYFDDGNTSRVECVWFWDKEGNIHVITERDFLEQYKPYEPVYEYKYATDIHCGTKILDRYFTEDEIKEEYKIYQRIDFTKRERK